MYKHKKQFRSEMKDKQLFAQKEETKRMMISLSKSKKKGRGVISNVLVPLLTSKQDS